MLKPNFIQWQKLIFLVVISLAITACNATNFRNDNQSAQVTEVTGSVTAVYIQEIPVIYTSYREIVNQSDAIVIGRPTRAKEILDTARDPNDPTRPDPNHFGVGQVYEVQVDGYLKGDGPLSIAVIQNHGLISTKTKELTEDDFEQARKRERILTLATGRRYVMFLVFSEYDLDDYPKGELLIGRGHPWRFEITGSGCVRLEDELPEMERYFPAQPLDEFVKFIQDPGSFPGDPYPAPGDSGICALEDTAPYP
jgi:hypothetical protein